MQSPSRWLVHTPMTEPGALEARVKSLRADVTSLNRVVHGLLVHCEWLGAYGADLSAFPSFSRATLPVSERLAALVERDALGLDEARTPTHDRLARAETLRLPFVRSFARLAHRRGCVAGSPRILPMAGKTIGFANIGTIKKASGS
jgi:hypothetical protein